MFNTLYAMMSYIITCVQSHAAASTTIYRFADNRVRYTCDNPIPGPLLTNVSARIWVVPAAECGVYTDLYRMYLVV